MNQGAVDRPGRGCLHILAFWSAGVGSTVLNGFVLAWWIRSGSPPSRLFSSVIVASGIASFVFYTAAAGLVRTSTHRPNLRLHWALLAGTCYGVGFLWPMVALTFWVIRRTPAGGKDATPSWVVWCLLGWTLVVLPVLLGRVFGRLMREIKPGSGLCVTCGYDLRASAGRCPECGNAVPVEQRQ